MSHASGDTRGLQEVQELLASIRQAIQEHGRQHDTQDVAAVKSSQAVTEMPHANSGQAEAKTMSMAQAIDELLEDDALEWEEAPGIASLSTKAPAENDSAAHISANGMLHHEQTTPGYARHGSDGAQFPWVDLPPTADETSQAGTTAERQADSGTSEGAAVKHSGIGISTNEKITTSTADDDTSSMPQRASSARRAVVSPLFPPSPEKAAPAAAAKLSMAAPQAAASARLSGHTNQFVGQSTEDCLASHTVAGERLTGQQVKHRQPQMNTKPVATQNSAKVVAMPSVHEKTLRPASGQIRNAAPMQGSLALDAGLQTQEGVSEQPAYSQPLLSPKTQARVQDALGRLERLEQAKAALGGEEALRQLARDLLEPMLARWLDDNLADIVERRVAEELARLRQQND